MRSRESIYGGDRCQRYGAQGWCLTLPGRVTQPGIFVNLARLVTLCRVTLALNHNRNYSGSEEIFLLSSIIIFISYAIKLFTEHRTL